MKKPVPTTLSVTTSRPTPKPAAKGKPISEEDDFGEATFARALKTVKETISQVSPADKAKAKRTQR